MKLRIDWGPFAPSPNVTTTAKDFLKALIARDRKTWGITLAVVGFMVGLCLLLARHDRETYAKLYGSWGLQVFGGEVVCVIHRDRTVGCYMVNRFTGETMSTKGKWQPAGRDVEGNLMITSDGEDKSKATLVYETSTDTLLLRIGDKEFRLQRRAEAKNDPGTETER